MDVIGTIFFYLLHIDNYLLNLVNMYGLWVYFILFLIIFCETGLVVLFFFPGDSLLFAAGGIAAHGESGLKIQILFVSLILASILGNKINYLLGKKTAPILFDHKPLKWKWLINKKYLQETQFFYAKHGGKTIILARFIPIVRTFAPFVAGIGNMSLAKFSFYNTISAFLWIGLLLLSGYFFNSIPFINQNFSLVIYGIVFLSLFLPWIVLLLKRKFVKIP